MKEERRTPLIFAASAFALALAWSGIALADGDTVLPRAEATPAAKTIPAQAGTSTPGTKAKAGEPAPAKPKTTDTKAVQGDTKDVPVTEVEVKARKEKVVREGSVEAGYKVENVATTGPWGEKKIQDTPYSINVMPSEMIENLGASTPDQLFRVNPLTQVNYTQARAGNVPVSIRGFRFSTSMLEDGVRNSAGYGVFLEDKERVEILTGLSGFLYGSGNVGGLVNYAIKRPTSERLNSITVGDYGGGSYYAHGDFGGKIDKNGMFSYRLNVLTQDGNTPVDFQSINKSLVSAALDWRITKRIILQFSGAYGHNRVNGLPAYWARATNVKAGDAPDPEKLWTQKWTFSKVNTEKLGVSGTWDISDMFTARAAYGYMENEREWHSVNSTIKKNGTYSELAKIQAPFKVIDNGGYAFLDMKAKTGPLQHKLTAGFYGNTNEYKYHEDASADVTLSGSFNLSNPVYVAEPAYSVGYKPWYTKTKSTSGNWIIGDDIKLNDQWSALAGVNYASIIAQTYKTDGSRKADSHYDKSALTPSVALMYKPLPWITTYAHYMESLEQGTIVPTTGSISYTNAGEMMAPLTSQQYELGAKASVRGMLLTAAFFYIDKPNEYDRTNSNGTHTYVQDGREVHKGFEFTATGKVMDNLRLYGGFTLLNAQVTSGSTASLDGKTPMDVSEQMAKVYGEYDLPCVRGLTFTGGIYYTGAFYGDTANNDKLPPVVTGDAGARYTTKVFDTPLTMRLNVMNVTNKSYWMSNYYTGDPRTITFSLQTRF